MRTYIVTRDAEVVETLEAETADEAVLKVTEEGTLYVRVCSVPYAPWEPPGRSRDGS